MADQQKINEAAATEAYKAGRVGDGGRHGVAQFFGLNSDLERANFAQGRADKIKYDSPTLDSLWSDKKSKPTTVSSSAVIAQESSYSGSESNGTSSSSNNDNYTGYGRYLSTTVKTDEDGSWVGAVVVAVVCVVGVLFLAAGPPTGNQVSYGAQQFSNTGLVVLPVEQSQQSAPETRLPTDPDTEAVQSALARQGFFSGAVDGRMTPQTIEAIQAFQRLRRQPVTGDLTSTQREALFFAPSNVRNGGMAPVPAPVGGTQNSASEAQFDPTVLAIQRALTAMGFNPGDNDGLMGRQTRGAIRAFQSSRAEPASGFLTQQQQSALLSR